MFPDRSKTLACAAVMLALGCFAAPAQAADPTTKQALPPAAPPVFTWTGFYVGFGVGYTWTGNPPISLSTVNLQDAGGFGPASALVGNGFVNARLNGFMFGGQAGYNWQFADHVVAGLEADLQGAGVRGGGGFNSIIAAPAGEAVTGVKLSRNLEYFGTVRGRLGVTVTPRLLAYVTGGLAYGGVDLTGTMRQSLTPSFLLGSPGKVNFFENRVGWTIGAGTEMALGGNLSAKLEYLYYDLGQVSLGAPAFSALAFANLGAGGALGVVDQSNVGTRYNGHMLRMGLNYRFDASAPEARGSAATPLFAHPRFTETERAAPGGWSIKLTPYLWAINVNGSSTLRGETVATDATIIDAITKSSAFPAAAMGRVEVSNGPWSAYGDMAWARLRFAGATLILRSPFADVALATSAAAHLRQTMAIAEAGVGYELARWKLSGMPNAVTTLDAYAGARYGYIGLNLSLEALGAIQSELLDLQRVGAASVQTTGRLQWVDPLVGLRMRHAIAPGQNFELRGDIGGFGVGTKFSWQAVGAYAPEFDVDGWKVGGLIGYRALSVDYSKTVSGYENGFNEIMHGPMVGVSLRL